MAQEAGGSVAGEGANADWQSEWEFDLGETVQLLWLPATGVVKGRTEYLHCDVQYLVEFVNLSGELVSIWVHDEAIDHQTMRH